MKYCCFLLCIALYLVTAFFQNQSGVPMPRTLSVPEKREKVNIPQKREGGEKGGKCMVYTDKLTNRIGD